MVAITRYVTIALALIQSTAMAIGFGRQGYLIEFNALNVITTITALTAGSAFLMWVGERITEKGIGNGISIVLVINIISRLPQDLSNLFEQFVFGKAPATAILAVVIIFAIIIAMVVMVIILNDGVRKIPVQYAKKNSGQKDGRRTDLQHSVEGKYFRRYSYHFCTVHYAVPDYYLFLYRI